MMTRASSTAPPSGRTTEIKTMEEKAPPSCAKEEPAGAGTGLSTTADAAILAGGGLVQAANRMWIMPDKEVRFLLSVERDQIRAYRRHSLLSHQAWVRRQYEANDGVVLLNDEMATRRAEHRRAVEEDFGDIVDHLDLSSGGTPLSQFAISDRYSDFFDSDDEEEEDGEEVVQAPVGANN